ncbi:MAG TPA: dihydrofolate reductase [Polyangia bacterium]|nr:dihydrofolate reductase [Polyangia bacterium]
MPPLALIAAVSRNGVIGRAGKVPWDLPEDRAYFQRSTWGHAIIMGRRTWDETGRALPGRRNIVVSRSGAVSGSGREVVPTLEEAIARARATDPDPFVIGGAEIFRLALPIATRLFLTEVAFDSEGDTFFPPFERRDWREVERRPGDRADYVVYERVTETDPPDARGERPPPAGPPR